MWFNSYAVKWTIIRHYRCLFDFIKLYIHEHNMCSFAKVPENIWIFIYLCKVKEHMWLKGTEHVKTNMTANKYY